GGLVLTGATLPAAPPDVTNAARAATTTAATPAPKTAPRAVQRVLCLVCIPCPFRNRSRCLTRRRFSPGRNLQTALFETLTTASRPVNLRGMPSDLARRALELVNIPSPSR